MRTIRLLAILLLAGCTATGEDAELSDYQPLLENSPFLSAAFKKRLADREDGGFAPFSFHGYARDKDGWLVCLFQEKSKKTIWLRVDEEAEGHRLTAFDVEEQKVTIEKDGIEKTIQLETP